MKKSIVYIALVSILLPLSASAKVERGYHSESKPGLSFVVDSVDYRKDLTRVYGRLIGAPHTSGRIDRISLAAPSGTMMCSDIDGVDFNRYFQWEASGVINTEMDFPAMRPAPKFEVTFRTPRGEFVTKAVKK